MTSIKAIVLLAVFLLTCISLFMLIHQSSTNDAHDAIRGDVSFKDTIPKREKLGTGGITRSVQTPKRSRPSESQQPEKSSPQSQSTVKSQVQKDISSVKLASKTAVHGIEKRGKLTCKGKVVDSEVIYWKIVPGDQEYESPATPHHGEHHEKYLTFQYDPGGWNNIRIALECFIVLGHAMGRTLVIPPQQHLYLLGRTHKDEEDEKAHDEMGFEDFFDVDLMRTHNGFHVMHMEEFLAKEGVTGGLKGGALPPENTSLAWGTKLWEYLDQVADERPSGWEGHFMAFPDHPGNFTKFDDIHAHAKQRMEKFAEGRQPVYYDERLQRAHHVHIQSSRQEVRFLQHFYGFAFFVSPEMQSFYRRFVRDYMRYRDVIQCAGSDLVSAIRAEARRETPNDPTGTYYALHIRRGDFQYKQTKISAWEILQNLHFPNGTPIIPPGHVVYISTDDPQGLCHECRAQAKPCTAFPRDKLPVGCPNDTSWTAFTQAGWKIRFLGDYLKKGLLKGVNPNQYGMIESIACSRAKVFAGTHCSTFTGYIHRMRGYHGLGEDTYFHTTGKVFELRGPKFGGFGWAREWRAGWTDDEGGLI